MTPGEDWWLEAMYGDMPEKNLQHQVELALATAGWLVYHTYDSRRSNSGFPDIVAVRGDRLIYRELKSQKGRLEPNQIKWRDALLAAGQDWRLWRPFDWGDGSINREIE